LLRAELPERIAPGYDAIHGGRLVDERKPTTFVGFIQRSLFGSGCACSPNLDVVVT
jgi:hypothetical protein